MKIDIFPHVLPSKYKEVLFKMDFPMRAAIESIPMLFDMDIRFREMDKHDNLAQVLTLGFPPIEEILGPAKTAELAKIANDGMAELVCKYPDRFVGAVACLPMNDIDAALKEANRALDELKFRGVQIHTPMLDKAPDSPEFMPLYAKMAQINLPIWIHPKRSIKQADFAANKESMYRIYQTFGWPYDTSAAMMHLVFSGIFDKFPNIKFITHHAGGMIPFFSERIRASFDKIEMVTGEKETFKVKLTRPTLDYFKMFYCDTALYGNTPALTCAHAFFGTEHMLFGTDMPLGDSQRGFRYTGITIEAVERMAIPEEDKKKIFEDNARQLLRLPV